MLYYDSCAYKEIHLQTEVLVKLNKNLASARAKKRQKQIYTQNASSKTNTLAFATAQSTAYNLAPLESFNYLLYYDSCAYKVQREVLGKLNMNLASARAKIRHIYTPISLPVCD